MTPLSNELWLAVASAGTRRGMIYSGILLVVIVALLPLWVRLGIVLHHALHRTTTWRDQVQNRFQHQSAMAWIFTWCKLRFDPMFHELPPLGSCPMRMGQPTEKISEKKEPGATSPALPGETSPLALRPDARRLLDIGCGYGIVSATLLTWLPEATILAVDPSAARVKATAGAIGVQGQAHVAGAPDFLPPGHEDDRFDAVLLVDVIHFLDDNQLDATLTRIAHHLASQGRLYLRSIIPPAPGRRGSLLWHYEGWRRRLWGIPTYHRPADVLTGHLQRAGLMLIHTGPSGGNPELHWFIATRARG